MSKSLIALTLPGRRVLLALALAALGPTIGAPRALAGEPAAQATPAAPTGPSAATAAVDDPVLGSFTYGGTPEAPLRAEVRGSQLLPLMEVQTFDAFAQDRPGAEGLPEAYTKLVQSKLNQAFALFVLSRVLDEAAAHAPQGAPPPAKLAEALTDELLRREAQRVDVQCGGKGTDRTPEARFEQLRRHFALYPYQLRLEATSPGVPAVASADLWPALELGGGAGEFPQTLAALRAEVAAKVQGLRRAAVRAEAVGAVRGAAVRPPAATDAELEAYLQAHGGELDIGVTMDAELLEVAFEGPQPCAPPPEAARTCLATALSAAEVEISKLQERISERQGAATPGERPEATAEEQAALLKVLAKLGAGCKGATVTARRIPSQLYTLAKPAEQPRVLLRQAFLAQVFLDGRAAARPLPNDLLNYGPGQYVLVLLKGGQPKARTLDASDPTVRERVKEAIATGRKIAATKEALLELFAGKVTITTVGDPFDFGEAKGVRLLKGLASPEEWIPQMFVEGNLGRFQLALAAP